MLVNSVGDLNGDSIGDFAVGCMNYDILGRSNAGAAFIIYGVNGTRTTDIDLLQWSSAASVGFRVIGGAAGDQLGSAVSKQGT